VPRAAAALALHSSTTKEASMATSSRSQSVALPLALTVFAVAFGASILYVLGVTTGLVVFGWSAPFAIWFVWASRHVETLEDRFVARAIETQKFADADAARVLVPVPVHA
jgi:hypothetical protein